MTFLESKLFTKLITETVRDDEYRRLQSSLIDFPDAGAVIRGGGGLRKLRWARAGFGKRGSFRVIYYWAKSTDTILMLFIYAKNETNDLTPD